MRVLVKETDYRIEIRPRKTRLQGTTEEKAVEDLLSDIQSVQGAFPRLHADKDRFFDLATDLFYELDKRFFINSESDGQYACSFCGSEWYDAAQPTNNDCCQECIGEWQAIEAIKKALL